MNQQSEQMGNNNNFDNSGVDNNGRKESDSMPQKTAKQVVLEFLSKHDYPHQPKDIYGGLIYSGDITFSYRSVEVAVGDLSAEGLLKKVEIDEIDGVVKDLPDDSNKRARYVITDKGKTRLSQ